MGSQEVSLEVILAALLVHQHISGQGDEFS